MLIGVPDVQQAVLVKHTYQYKQIIVLFKIYLNCLVPQFVLTYLKKNA